MAAEAPGGRARRPEWLRKSRTATAGALEVTRRVAELGLHTVCQSARCPNLDECFAAGTATFLILGDRCTRACAFCAVDHEARLLAPDPGEGARIAGFVRAGGIRYAVLTSVTRDDLPDGGAAHFAAVARAIKEQVPGCRIEVLIPDFRGSAEALRTVCASPIDVLGHNVETVPRLYGRVRPGASYERSLDLLEAAKRREGRITKTGLMVGLGESREELIAVFRDVSARGVDMLTIGQYLRPEGRNLPVARYYPPEEFAELRRVAESAGIGVVVSGPYVRSSYLADRAFAAARRDESGAGGERGTSGEKDV